MAAIFVGSSLPDSSIPGDVPDVSLHEVGYCGLAIVLVRAVAQGRWAGVTLRTLALAWLIAIGYGATDEWHQSFVPTRHAEFRDWFADAIGALAGVVVVGAWSIIRRL